MKLEDDPSGAHVIFAGGWRNVTWETGNEAALILETRTEVAVI